MLWEKQSFCTFWSKTGVISIRKIMRFKRLRKNKIWSVNHNIFFISLANAFNYRDILSATLCHMHTHTHAFTCIQYKQQWSRAQFNYSHITFISIYGVPSHSVGHMTLTPEGKRLAQVLCLIFQPSSLTLGHLKWQ